MKLKSIFILISLLIVNSVKPFEKQVLATCGLVTGLGITVISLDALYASRAQKQLLNFGKRGTSYLSYVLPRISRLISNRQDDSIDNCNNKMVMSGICASLGIVLTAISLKNLK